MQYKPIYIKKYIYTYIKPLEHDYNNLNFKYYLNVWVYALFD